MPSVAIYLTDELYDLVKKDISKNVQQAIKYWNKKGQPKTE